MIMWRNNVEPTVFEDSEPCYQSRTAINAHWSDITLAFAVDLMSPGELETKEAAGEKFIAFKLPDGDAAINNPVFVEKTVNEVIAAVHNHPGYASADNSGIKLNIAGNRLSVLARRGISQNGIDRLMFSVIGGLVANSITIKEVRSGGQSGVDEAGIHAAQDYGLRCSILCPKGFRFSTAEGVELSGEELFKSRFK